MRRVCSLSAYGVFATPKGKWNSAPSLHNAGLIKVHEVCGETFLWVPTFTKHQTPHMKEKPKGYPNYSASYDEAPDKHHTCTVLAHLNPESGYPKEEIPGECYDEKICLVLNGDKVKKWLEEAGHGTAPSFTLKIGRKKPKTMKAKRHA